jgi:hypothetical protein
MRVFWPNVYQHSYIIKLIEIFGGKHRSDSLCPNHLTSTPEQVCPVANIGLMLAMCGVNAKVTWAGDLTRPFFASTAASDTNSGPNFKRGGVAHVASFSAL